MKEKYKSVNLDYDLIVEKYHDLGYYEETVNAYLSDPFFKELEGMLDDEDYELAKDALKGLYILASELCLFPLYECLLEIYEDLQYEMYDELMKHYREMIECYERICNVFHS